MRSLDSKNQTEAKETHYQACAVDLIAPAPIVIARPGGALLCYDGAQRAIGKLLLTNEVKESEVLRQLLAGSLLAAGANQLPDTQAVEPNLLDCIFNLCAAFQTTHATPTIMRRARDRFTELGDIKSAEFAEEKAREEAGHDKLAMLDLEAMGLPAATLNERFAPRRATALVEAFETLSRANKPYGVFGYAYVLERLAMRSGQAEIDANQSLAPEGVDITHCQRVHSAVGADLSHVVELIDFIADLPTPFVADVCRAVYRTGQIMFDVRNEDQEKRILSTLLERWQWKPFVGAMPD
ncbi:MAG: hypothetical protein AAGF57_05280 [Pseudomonadota bacterium]